MKPVIAIATIGISLLALGCSGRGETAAIGPGTGLSASPSLRPLAVAPADATAATLQTRFITTAPNSTCSIAGTNDPSNTPTYYADDYGSIRVDYVPGAPGVSLALDRVDPSGTHTTVDVPSAPQQSAPRAGLAKGHMLRPALKGDPLAPTNSQLRALHYPPRPDPTKSPRRYATWLSLVSDDAEYVPARTVAQARPSTGILDVNTATAPNNNVWSGAALLYFDSWLAAEGLFTIPTATPPQVECTCQTSWASMWVGVDGWGTGNVVQDGVHLNTFTILIGNTWISLPTYDAWYEYYPGNSQGIMNFPVSAGQSIFSLAWIGDSAGNESSTGTLAWFVVQNRSNNNQFVETNLPLNMGFSGASAEWIIEKSASLPLTKYSTALFTDAFAADYSLNERDFNSTTNYELWLENGNDNFLSIAYEDGTGYGVQLDWLGGQ